MASRGEGARQFALLRAVRQAILASSSAEQLLERVGRVLVEQVSEYCVIDTRIASIEPVRLSILHADASLDELLAAAASRTSVAPRGRIARAFSSGRLDAFAASPAVLEEFAFTRKPVVSGVCLPIRWSQSVLAVLTLVLTRPRSSFGGATLDSLEEVAAWCGVGIAALDGDAQAKRSAPPPRAVSGEVRVGAPNRGSLLAERPPSVGGRRTNR